MKHRVLAYALAAALPASATGFTIVEPSVPAQGVPRIVTPDENVRTLGKVQVILDLAAKHDTLFELAIRRSGLTLGDGQPITAFGYDKEAGIIVAGSRSVSHVSVVGVHGKQGEREASVLFHNAYSEVIAPPSEDFAVFDLSFNRIGFDYTPLDRPQRMHIPVSVLIDRSGSMKSVMPEVLRATREFLETLPAFTRCELLTFSDTVERLTPSASDALVSCPRSKMYLPSQIKAGSTTALYEVLQQGFERRDDNKGYRPPKLVIILTDGVNTVHSALTKDDLVRQKDKAAAKLFVFWSGSQDPAHLNQLSDWEVIARDDIKTALEQFFGSIGVSVSGIQTLRLGAQSRIPKFDNHGYAKSVDGRGTGPAL